MTLKNPGIAIAKLVAAGMLFGAVGRHQYDYYTLLRWVVCGVSAFAAFKAAELRKGGWVWTFAIVALAFNPIIPVYLNRDIWAFIDLTAAVLLLISIFVIDRHSPIP